MAKLKNAPVALIIMDGVGYGNTADNNNAVQIAKTPVLDELKQKFPATHIFASGEYVGLPDGQMGNSEVGHTNMQAELFIRLLPVLPRQSRTENSLRTRLCSA